MAKSTAKTGNLVQNPDGSVTFPDGTTVSAQQAQQLQLMSPTAGAPAAAAPKKKGQPWYDPMRYWDDINNALAPASQGISNVEQRAVGMNPPPGGPAGGTGGEPAKKPAAATTPAATTSQTAPPAYDPLALQQMWAGVFGPIFAQTAKMMGNMGPDYLNSMTQAIAGSNQSDAFKASQLQNAKATSDLLNTYAGSQLQQVAAGPTFDTLINWLQQATGAGQLAQGAAEKAIAYGTNLNAAQAFGVPSATSATSSNNLSPQQAAALTNQALTGTQTGSSPLTSTGTTGTTGTAGSLVNPLLPTNLLSSQGLANPPTQATIP